MATYQTTELKENKNDSGPSIRLDNQVVTTGQFNETLKGLKRNQRIVEVDDHDFHIVERLFD